MSRKLTNVKPLGRYHNPDTGTDVNVHYGSNDRGQAVYFYWNFNAGGRIRITEHDLRSTWKKRSDTIK